MALATRTLGYALAGRVLPKDRLFIQWAAKALPARRVADLENELTVANKAVLVERLVTTAGVIKCELVVT